MKRIISMLLVLMLLCTIAMPMAFAADQTSGITYELKVDCGDGGEVKPGSIVTVSFVVKSDSKHYISVMQNEIIYDQNFYEYVSGSAEAVKSGSNALHQTRVAGTHIIKASYLSPNGGQFSAEETMCTFKLRVVGTSGEGWIRSDWSCAKAYNEENDACALKDGGDITVVANGPCHPFKDVKASDWFHEAVDYVSLRGLMNGVEDEIFAPNGTMTRAMLVTVLYRLNGSEEVTGTNPFADVKSGQWYTDAVIWAKNNGIVDGISDTEFAPNSNVTREQIATIMCRYAKFIGCSVENHADLVGYDDVSAISDWAADSMRWANSVGLITGRTDTTLVPKGTATRAEVATILMRFCENILK